jgi:hypothetical protein
VSKVDVPGVRSVGIPSPTTGLEVAFPGLMFTVCYYLELVVLLFCVACAFQTFCSEGKAAPNDG